MSKKRVWLQRAVYILLMLGLVLSACTPPPNQSTASFRIQSDQGSAGGPGPENNSQNLLPAATSYTVGAPHPDDPPPESSGDFSVQAYPINTACYDCRWSALSLNTTYVAAPFAPASDSFSLAHPDLNNQAAGSSNGYHFTLNPVKYGRTPEGKKIATRLRLFMRVSADRKDSTVTFSRSIATGYVELVSSDGLNYSFETYDPRYAGISASYSEKTDPDPAKICARRVSNSGTTNRPKSIESASLRLDEAKAQAEIELVLSASARASVFNSVCSSPTTINGTNTASFKVTADIKFENDPNDPEPSPTPSPTAAPDPDASPSLDPSTEPSASPSPDPSTDPGDNNDDDDNNNDDDNNDDDEGDEGDGDGDDDQTCYSGDNSTTLMPADLGSVIDELQQNDQSLLSIKSTIKDFAQQARSTQKIKEQMAQLPQEGLNNRQQQKFSNLQEKLFQTQSAMGHSGSQLVAHVAQLEQRKSHVQQQTQPWLDSPVGIPSGLVSLSDFKQAIAAIEFEFDNLILIENTYDLLAATRFVTAEMALLNQLILAITDQRLPIAQFSDEPELELEEPLSQIQTPQKLVRYLSGRIAKHGKQLSAHNTKLQQDMFSDLSRIAVNLAETELFMAEWYQTYGYLFEEDGFTTQALRFSSPSFGILTAPDLDPGNLNLSGFSQQLHQSGIATRTGLSRATSALNRIRNDLSGVRSRIQELNATKSQRKLTNTEKSDLNSLKIQKKELEHREKNAQRAQKEAQKRVDQVVKDSKAFDNANKRSNSCRKDPNAFKTFKKTESAKEGAKDIFDWVKKHPEGRPRNSENGKKFAERMMRSQYGDNWRSHPTKGKTGPDSDFNKIKKYGDRAFE